MSRSTSTEPGSTKLAAGQLAEIRRRYVPGRAGRPASYPLPDGTTRALALEFRVSQTTIRRILAGK